MRPKTRLMYIEDKSQSLVGDAVIGRGTFSKTGRSVHYKGRTFQSLNGHGFKANYFDVDTGAHYWISGCRMDGADRLYNGGPPVPIDEDVREAYWTEIQGMPGNRHKATT